ncbi:MAG: 30S ribosomal protein S9 [Chloroflexi bacterium]|nr:30S ribosomal protein S9 [Chloroflexota bacterium]
MGRRKTSIARVVLQPGTGNITINGKPLEETYTRPLLQMAVSRPLRVTNTIGSLNMIATVQGGGVTGQAGAISHAAARALLKLDESHKAVLRQDGLLTRDSRMKERKKYGLKRARKAPQYTKR